jgi:hypothetical protein
MLRQMERLFGSIQSQPNPKAIARRTRYYFHVSNGGQFLDETGEEFSTRAEAIARGSILAAELRKEGDWSGYAVTVTDEEAPWSRDCRCKLSPVPSPVSGGKHLGEGRAAVRASEHTDDGR